MALANTVKNMKLKLGQDDLKMPGTPNFVQGGGSGTAEVVLSPTATQLLQKTGMFNAGSRETLSGPHSSDMIPPLQGLSRLEVSFGSGSDVSMTDADSVLGKRQADGEDKSDHKLDLALSLKCRAPYGGKQKKGRKSGATELEAEKNDTVADRVAARTRRKTSTGTAVPGNLTRPKEGSRQEQ
jgi:hypothetical protein